MRTRANALRKPLSSMMLMVVFTIVLSFGLSSRLSSSDATTASNVQFENNKEPEKIADACEIMACIGALKDVCEMKITVMTNFKEADKRDAVRIKTDDVAETEMVIVIAMQKEWSVKGAPAFPTCLDVNDQLAYKKYKSKNQVYDAYHFAPLLRRLMRMKLDQQIRGCGFTYGELFQAAEALVKQPKAQLGNETLFMKTREFNKPSSDKLFSNSANLPEKYSILFRTMVVFKRYNTVDDAELKSLAMDTYMDTWEEGREQPSSNYLK